MINFIFKKSSRRTQSRVRRLLLPLCAAAGIIAGTGSLSGQELFIGKSEVSPSEVDKIYVRGLNYLVRSQTAEGNWGDGPYGGEPAVVGLSVVSMLAHGDDPNFGPYADSIHRGLSFILKQMNPKTGYIGRSMYNHGFATLALAES